MDVDHQDPALEELEVNPRADAGYPVGVIKAYRKRMQQIRAAKDERDLYTNRGMRFEKLQGDRVGQCSIRLDLQFRLIVRLDGKAAEKRLTVLEIADYH